MRGIPWLGNPRIWQAGRLPHNGLGSKPNNALSFQKKEPLRLWTYRVCRNQSGRYAIREVFYEHDGRLISYGKHPVAPLAASLEDLIQLVEWYRDALDSPILSLEAVEAQLSPQSTPDSSTPTLPLATVIAQLAQTPDSSSDLTPVNPPTP